MATAASVQTTTVSSTYTTSLRFAFGGLSCMAAACVTNPVDVIKIRLQIQGELAAAGAPKIYNGMVRGMWTIISLEGPAALWKGLFPSLLREASYSTLRMGLYEPVKELLGATNPANTPLWKKICAGATAGAVGAGIANPTDLIKVRMQAEAKLPAGTPPRYHGTLDAFKQIYRSEGLAGLYKGVGPTTQRASLLTASQLPAYDHSKHLILKHQWLQEGRPLHFASSMLAGLVAAAVTSPVDVVKTRIMNQKPGQHLYLNTVDCFTKILRSEGLHGLYKGFIPNWIRLGPHTIVTFIVFEELRKLAGLPPI
eukprot:GILJ01004544.1.p1 GENE.GILJ01004544.1~~GILJ01004544.1.p1  ORF type:complete len:323 (-),score=30.87 GILJ01004544.1:210-1142(-)